MQQVAVSRNEHWGNLYALHVVRHRHSREAAFENVVGIYLWETKDAADAFYSDEWLAGVTERWGAAPVKQEWIVPLVAESVEGRVVTAGAPTPG